MYGQQKLYHSFFLYSHTELRLLQLMIQATISALAQCIVFQSEDGALDNNSLSPERIKQIFHKAAEMLPGSPVLGTLDVAGSHLVSAYTIGRTIQADTKSPDLGRLLMQKTANVHLGIALSVLAFPCSPIDPVGIENSKWKYLNAVVSLAHCLLLYTVLFMLIL